MLFTTAAAAAAGTFIISVTERKTTQKWQSNKVS